MNAHDAVTVRVSEDTRMGLEPANRDSSPRPWEWLYVTVGHGMWAFVRTRFDVQVLGAFPTVERGQVWVSTHREETDVPVLAGAMTVLGGMRRNGNARVHFAARDDLFERGVVSAGLRLPAPLARLAWPITPGPWLPRVRAHPIRRPTGAKLGQLLADLDPDLPLERALGSDLIARFAGRAAELGRPAPLTVGAARHPVFATVLWDDVTDRGQLADTAAANWHAHTARAAADVRRLVGLAQAGEPLLLFPEGKVSPDGALGPVGEIVTLLARRGGVRQVVPVALAYDPLRRRRTTVAVHAGPPIATERMASVGDLATLLLRQMPVTVGQVVCGCLWNVIERGETTVTRRALLEAMRAAVARDRPAVRALGTPGARARALAAAVGVLRRRGLVSGGPAELHIDGERVRADAMVTRLANEARAVAAAAEP